MLDIEKIPVRNATVHVSSNSRLNTRIVPSPWSQVARKIPSARYYSTSMALYESCKYLRPGRSGVFRRPRWSFPDVSRLGTSILSSSETSIFATKFHRFSVSWNRLRGCEWRRPCATWRLHIKTVPSHNIFELFNPDGFSNCAFVRAPGAREHRKRMIGA